MNTYLFSDGSLESGLSLENCLDEVETPGNYVWVDITGDDFDSLRRISECFNIHPLSIEDAEQPNQRPKLELFDQYLILVVRTPNLDYERGEIDTFQLALIVGENFLVTVHRPEIQSIDRIRQMVETGNNKFLFSGPDYLACWIIDYSVDRFLDLLGQIDDHIEFIEDEVFDNPSNRLLEDISDLRSDILYLQRTINPQRDELSKITRQPVPFIDEEVKVYFRDVQDHITRSIELLANYRELVAGARDMYMTTISNRMNEVMKTLTIIATIFIPLTFLAGIYGMNFTHMPELGWPWSYYSLLGFMGMVTGGMIYYFKHKDWF